ncbi:MAG: hypothetical protein LIP28_10920 [Deltaproteobacteria bacterium]|nr:hypothetical protein [Deltaproteobacteria bacterium]
MARFFIHLFFFCAIACIPYQAAHASLSGSGAPAARILYTADTLGCIHPCRTCGGSSQGGIARRAALLREYAAGRPRPLILAGPNEFYSDRKEPDPATADRLAPALNAAFARMPYAAVYLSPATARDWRRRNLAAPPAAVPVADRPVIRVFQAGRLTVACVFLPPGAEPGGGPSPDQILAARLAASEAALSAEVVIAVSPWGMMAENSLASSLGGYYHIVLGGGEGIAVPGQATGDPGAPGPLWVRSDRRGRAVNVVDIHALPTPGSPWLEGVHFTSRLHFLEPDLPQDEDVLDAVKGLKDVE